MMQRTTILSLVLAAGIVCGLGSNARAQSAPAQVIRITFVGLSNNIGRVGCIIFNSADGFPRVRSKAAGRTHAPIQNQAGTCEFKNLPPGTYAAAVFHDQYETGKMKTNLLGMPQEAFGFSNDAKPSTLTPPSFDAASFSYPGGTMDITVQAQH